MEIKERVLWVDGLKGISCFFIFLHHFYLCFYPETFYGTLIEATNTSDFNFFSQMPFNFFMNGNFFVFIFILLSGFISIYVVNSSNTFNIGINFINKLIKLSIPLLIYELILIILYKIGLINYFFIGSPTIKDFILSNVFKTFLLGDTRFGGHFWMLPFIFIGGTFVTILANLSLINSKNSKRNLLILYIIISLYLLLFINEYYAAIFLGPVLFLIYETQGIKASHFMCIILLIISLFFGGFPSGHIEGMEITNIYKYFVLPFRTKLSCIYWHLFAAFLLIICCCVSSKIQSFFSKKIFIRLNKISYSFYIIHPFFISTANYLIKKYLNNSNGLYNIIIHFILILLLGILFFLSFFLSFFLNFPH